MDAVTEWLLKGPAWIQYRTLTDIMDRDENNPEVITAKQSMLAQKQIQGLLSELPGWPGQPLRRHNDASHLLHKLVFISDLGLKASDPGISQIVKHITEHQSKEGAYQVVANISPNYGGTGTDQLVWMLCDAPSILYALIKLGFEEDPGVQAAIGHLASLSSDSGWPCVVTPDLGKFRGPGRKTDPCPYATLVALKALSQVPEWRDSKVCQTGVEALLSLWSQRKESRPYLFAMGTDFAKLKAPLIWYDILHVTEVLTQFPWLLKDRRLLEMIGMIKAKADNKGFFTAESVWKSWSEWEFGQKRNPSLLITLLVKRVLKRMG